ncbi:DUF4097 family beta strand repeat-containing protein [Catenulispora subtropica]|uniref:DUF4097 domain-containing protein n=1 Tax=Catenulispora subtropica TaxID=450798 RepID=A0ABP5DKG8_9ACTN
MRAGNGTGTRRIVLAAAAGAAAGLAVGVSGCGWLNDRHVENDATITEPVRAVRIDNGAGQVTVHRGDASGGIVVRRDIDYHGDRPPTPGQTVTDGTLHLTANCSDCGIAYDVTVPESTSLTVIDGAGEVRVAGLSGPIAIKAAAGHVEGTDLRATAVTVEASAGAVDLAFATAPTTVSAHSHAGEVTVTVPDGAYAVDAKADAGHRSVDVTDSPASPRRLTVWSDAGAVTVQPA